jgi:hypothetical protein
MNACVDLPQLPQVNAFLSMEIGGIGILSCMVQASVPAASEHERPRISASQPWRPGQSLVHAAATLEYGHLPSYLAVPARVISVEA